MNVQVRRISREIGFLKSEFNRFGEYYARVKAKCDALCEERWYRDFSSIHPELQTSLDDEIEELFCELRSLSADFSFFDTEIEECEAILAFHEKRDPHKKKWNVNKHCCGFRKSHGVRYWEGHRNRHYGRLINREVCFETELAMDEASSEISIQIETPSLSWEDEYLFNSSPEEQGCEYWEELKEHYSELLFEISEGLLGFECEARELADKYGFDVEELNAAVREGEIEEMLGFEEELLELEYFA